MEAGHVHLHVGFLEEVLRFVVCCLDDLGGIVKGEVSLDLWVVFPKHLCVLLAFDQIFAVLVLLIEDAPVIVIDVKVDELNPISNNTVFVL